MVSPFRGRRYELPFDKVAFDRDQAVILEIRGKLYVFPKANCEWNTETMLAIVPERYLKRYGLIGGRKV